MTKLSEIETPQDARRVVDIMRQEMAMQRETFIMPYRREKENVQNLIETIDVIEGEVTADLQAGSVTVDTSTEAGADALRDFLIAYRNRIMTQLSVHEEQYGQTREEVRSILVRLQQWQQEQEAKQRGQQIDKQRRVK